MGSDLLAHFPEGFMPRPEQARLLRDLERAVEASEGVFLVEAPPGVGKSHVAMTLARWSGDAYLLTSQKLLQDQYEREFGDAIQLVKGRDNYPCELYPPEMGVTTSYGKCRRPRGPRCQCPYARAKAAALNGPIFCTNTAYFATLRQWHGEQLRRRRLLVIDEAHNLEAQLTSVFTVSFTADQMKEWFGRPLPRLESAEAYRVPLEEQLERLEIRLENERRRLQCEPQPEVRAEQRRREPAARRGPSGSRRADDSENGRSPDPALADLPISREEQELQGAIQRIRFFLDPPETEWAVRYPPEPGSRLELVPLSVARLAPALLFDAAELTVLSSAFLGHRAVLAACFGLSAGDVRTVSVGSPFAVEQRPIVYRPVGALSKDSLAHLEPALGAEVATILGRHEQDKGLIHAPSYAVARRLLADLVDRAPAQARRILFVEAGTNKPRALEQHRESRQPTVLLSPSMREGVDLPDDFLRFQIITKMPYPDLGDPWTAARQARDPRWYALETAKALVQAYGRSCRHAADHGTTYVLDAQFQRFLTRYRPLLPPWFLDAADAALLEHKRATSGPKPSPRLPCDHPALFAGHGADVPGLPCPRCHRWIDGARP